MRRTTRFLAPSFVLGTTIFFFFLFVCLPFREFLAKQQTHTHNQKVYPTLCIRCCCCCNRTLKGKMRKDGENPGRLCTPLVHTHHFFLQFRALFALLLSWSGDNCTNSNSSSYSVSTYSFIHHHFLKHLAEVRGGGGEGTKPKESISLV